MTNQSYTHLTMQTRRLATANRSRVSIRATTKNFKSNLLGTPGHKKNKQEVGK